MKCLPYLQCYDCEYCQDDGYYPEANGNLRFMDRCVGRFDDVGTFRVQLAVLCPEVVMDGGAFKDALFYSMCFTPFLIPNLHDDT